MAEVTVRHELDCSADDYWNKCVFNDAFNQALYVERLHFGSFVSIESKDLGDRRTKKAKMEPPLTGVPAPVKKAIGDRDGLWTTVVAAAVFCDLPGSNGK